MEIIESWTATNLRGLILLVTEKVRANTYLNEIFEFYGFDKPLTEKDFGRVSIDKNYLFRNIGNNPNNIGELARHLTNRDCKVKVSIRSDFNATVNAGVIENATLSKVWFYFKFIDLNIDKVAYFPNIRFRLFSNYIQGLDAGMNVGEFNRTIMDNIVKCVESNNEIDKFRRTRKELAALHLALSKY